MKLCWHSFQGPHVSGRELKIMIVDDSNVGSHHGKKKKKRSFLQRQKRLAKHGSYGRGTPLSTDMYEYFMNIMKVMNTKKEDEEEMCILTSNVLNEIDGKEAEYCCNQIVSRVVENLLPFSSDEEFSNFLEKFSKNLRPVFCDMFGSHVLEQSLVVAFTKYEKSIAETDSKLNIKFYDYILKVSNFLFNNLDEFIWDTYSNAIGRTVFNVLSGNPVKGEIKLGLETQESLWSEEKKSQVTAPNEFKSIIKKFIKKMLSWPLFDNLCKKPITSTLLQSLLLASKDCNESSELVKKIIEVYKTNPLDLTTEENTPFVRLLEVTLNVTDENDYKEIYKLVFKNQVIDLSISKSGNFSVQKLIMNCQSEKIFEKIFVKLESKMEDILKAGHSGVLLALVKGCRRLGVVQGDCMTMLGRIFQAKDANNLVASIINLKPMENFNYETLNVTLLGSLIIQELLYFKKPIGIVNSLLELPDSNLVKLLSDVKGSHITDAFVKSPTIGEKGRDRLFKRLKGHYFTLATSKFGSRSLDAVWSVIKVQQKAILAEELKEKQSELCNNIYGKGFARKIHLDSFRRNRDEWIKLKKTTEATEKYFADIIPSKKRKKSNVNEINQ